MIPTKIFGKNEKTKQKCTLGALAPIIIFSTLSFLAIYFLLINIGKDGNKCAENNSIQLSKAKVELINTRKDLRKEFHTILDYTKFFDQHQLDENLIKKFKNNDKFNNIFSSKK